MPVEKQVLIILAANAGFLDGINVDQAGDFEKALYEYFDSRHADLLEGILKDKTFGKNVDKPEKMSETTRKVIDALNKFKDQF